MKFRDTEPPCWQDLLSSPPGGAIVADGAPADRIHRDRIDPDRAASVERSRARPERGVACPAAVRVRVTSLALIAAGGLLAAQAAGATAISPCAPRVSAIGGHREIAYCGPATVVIALGGRTYRFRNGLCDLSTAMGALELDVGTLVGGVPGNAGRPFVSLVIAHSPSWSEAFDAYVGGRRLFGESAIVAAGTLYSSGTFTGVLGAAFSGSWDCHGLVYSGP